MFTSPHPPPPPRSSSDPSQPWSKVCAWLSRERGRAGRLLQVALSAARAASASPNVVPPRPPRRTAIDEIVWHSRPEAEPRPARDDTRPVMFDWVNIRRAGEDHRVERALPAIPPQTEKEGRTYAVKRKPVPSLDNFHDEGLHEARVIETGALGDETHHGGPYTWPVTFSPSSHDFQDSASDQEDSDQDSYDQDMDMEHMRGDSESEVDVWDRGLVVAELCNKWGWTLEDVLETLEQPSQEGRRKCLREKGVLQFGKRGTPGGESRLVIGSGLADLGDKMRNYNSADWQISLDVEDLGSPTLSNGHNQSHRSVFAKQSYDSELIAKIVPDSFDRVRIRKKNNGSMRAIVRSRTRFAREGSLHSRAPLDPAPQEERQKGRVSKRSVPRAGCGVAIAEAVRAVEERTTGGRQAPTSHGLPVAKFAAAVSRLLYFGGINSREEADIITPTRRRRTEYAVGVLGRGSRKFGREAQNRIQSPTLDQESAVKVNMTPVGRYFFSINPVWCQGSSPTPASMAGFALTQRHKRPSKVCKPTAGLVFTTKPRSVARPRNLLGVAVAMLTYPILDVKSTTSLENLVI
ncbi:hypothetical protein EDB86DRAFT_2827787 [Lactarius hatsudake]|nr:hypothetical protein EDB86DRAFT_2827787 [Lactarius hatsudake]